MDKLKKYKTIKIRYSKDAFLVGHYYHNKKSDKCIIIFPGTSGFKKSFEVLAKPFLRDYSVYIFDINSHGESTGEYKTKDIIKSFTKVSKQAKKGCRQLYGIGHSMGGYGLGFVAARNPGLFKKICLISTPSSLKELPTMQLLRFARIFPGKLITTAVKVIDRVLRATNNNYRELSRERLKTINPYFAGLRFNKIKSCIKDIYTSPVLMKEANKITCPTLSIYGANDHIISYKIMKDSFHQMYNKINAKNKRLIIVKGADHNLNQRTSAEGPFNTSKKFQWIKKEIRQFFD